MFPFLQSSSCILIATILLVMSLYTVHMIRHWQNVSLCDVWWLDELVNWCFEPSQPLWIIAGLKTNFNTSLNYSVRKSPQWGAADAEINVSSGENTDLKRTPFKAWSRSVYSRTCYACCQGFLPCKFLPFRPIYLQFKKKKFFLCSACVNSQNKIGHPAGYKCQRWVAAEYK